MRVLALLFSAVALQAMEVVALPGQSPIINFRFVFRCGSLNDPAGKEGGGVDGGVAGAGGIGAGEL